MMASGLTPWADHRRGNGVNVAKFTCGGKGGMPGYRDCRGPGVGLAIRPACDASRYDYDLYRCHIGQASTAIIRTSRPIAVSPSCRPGIDPAPVQITSGFLPFDIAELLDGAGRLAHGTQAIALDRMRQARCESR